MSTALDTETVTKLKVPSSYKVVLLNDDYTPMDFVMEILEVLFAKSPEEAQALCIQVHQAGRGVAGIYSKEVADQKVSDVNKLAKFHKHPLKTIAEQA